MASVYLEGRPRLFLEVGMALWTSPASVAYAASTDQEPSDTRLFLITTWRLVRLWGAVKLAFLITALAIIVLLAHPA